MDGDTSDIAELVRIKNEFDCSLYVDEAHSTGLFGRTGLGLCDELSLAGEVDFIMCTLGKALASAGAYVVCSPIQKSLLVNRCRTFIFTTALAPINAMWTLFVLKKVANMGGRRARLREISSVLRKKLSGLKTLGNTQILPVVLGSNAAAAEASRAMREAGIWSPPVRYPTVPKNSARLRLSLNAALTYGHLDLIADTLNKYAERVL